MNKKILLLAIVVVFVLIAGACAGNEAPEQPAPGDNNQQQGKDEPKQENVNVAETIVAQWKESAHATAVGEETPEDAPGMRENCAKCHNGYAFELNAENLEGIGILKGQSCDTCHTKWGAEIMDKGTVETAIGTIEDGTGAVCSACHNGRGKEPNGESAPHHSNQTDMLLSKNGAEVEGFNYGTSPHAGVTDTCLGCHMSEDENDIKDHTFKMNKENIANSCNRCHPNFQSFNPEAKGDYDGDGNKEGMQDEVAGLVELLTNKINEQLNGGKVVSSHGKVVFQDAQENEIEAPDEKLYGAAWNAFYVDYDGSQGIHNPNYSVQLLQQSYKDVTGEDVPNADLRE